MYSRGAYVASGSFAYVSKESLIKGVRIHRLPSPYWFGKVKGLMPDASVTAAL